MSNNIAQNPFSGLPPELWPEALEDFDPFYRKLLIEGWNAKRELAALKRMLHDRCGLFSWDPEGEVRRQREEAWANWPGIGQ